MKSITKSKEVFRIYIFDLSVNFQLMNDKLPNFIKFYLLDLEFGSSLDNFITIMWLIHKIQKISKINNAIVDQVYNY